MEIEGIRTVSEPGRIFAALRLPQVIEQAFRVDERDRRRRETVFGLALGTFFYVAVLSIDWITVPDVCELNLVVRLCIGVPVNLAMIGLVARRDCGDAARQWAACIVGLACSLTISAVMALSVSPGAIVYVSVNLVILGFTINLVALRPGVAALLCVVITAIMVAAAAASPFGTPGVVLIYVVLGTMVTIVCVFANWSLQNERRRTFLTLRRDKIRLRQISAQRDLLERLAAIDPLTGLANRRGFDAMLDGDIARASAGMGIGVAMIDIDCFKAFNDTYGHPRGDAVLRAVAAALAEACGPGVRLGRMGGEEFAAVAVGAEPAALRALGERLRLGVETLALPHRRNSAGRVVTVSVGLAWTCSAGTADRAALFGAADTALYRAKGAGRNCSVGAADELCAASPRGPGDARTCTEPVVRKAF